MAMLIALVVGLAVATPSLGETGRSGALTVEPTPPVDSQITVNGVARNAGTIRDLSLPAGSHVVCYEATAGHLPPPCDVVTVEEGHTTILRPVFSPSGVLDITTSPVQPSATITVNGVVRDIAGVRVPVAAGVHEVCFGQVSGLVTPACETVEVAAGVTTTLAGRYEEQAAPSPEPDPTDPGHEDPQPTDPGTGGSESEARVTMSGQVEWAGGNSPWSAVVTLRVETEGGRPVGDVEVAGTWTTSRPARSVTAGCVTASDGTCTVAARDMTAGAGNRATFTRHQAAGVDVELTGHGSITVNRNGDTTTD
jgi:hypothetical protein